MTVCLAVIARQARAIVAVADTKLANQTYSHDFGAMKLRTLVNRWSVMFAGLPDQFEKLQRHINRELEQKGRPQDVDAVIEATEIAYAKELERLVNREVLSPFGLTLKEFRNAPRKKFRPKLYRDLTNAINYAGHNRPDHPNATELILLGFDPFNDPHLIGVSPTGECSEHYQPGYWIIGTGEPLARAYLQAHDLFINSPRLGEVVYRMQAAKFAAEKSPYVTNKNTITTVFHFDGRLSVDYGAKESRKYYDEDRARFPDDMVKVVESSLMTGWQYPV